MQSQWLAKREVAEFSDFRSKRWIIKEGKIFVEQKSSPFWEI